MVLIKGRALLMGLNSAHAVVLGAALILYGCTDTAGNQLLSSPGDQSATPPTQQAAASSAAVEQPPPDASPATEASSAPAAPSRSTSSPSVTGTFVGAKVNQHSRELASLVASVEEANQRFDRLREITEQNAQRYYAIVAAVSARLQIGSTPGNPVLVSQWNSAQSELDRILGDIAALNTLANDVAAQAAMSNYLIESIGAAYTLSGAVEEDHRQLAKIEDNVNRTVVLVDRLLGDVNETITRQTGYVNNERQNLMALSLGIKNGELFGAPLASRAFATTVTTQPRKQPNPAVASDEVPETRQPLVVIRFDRPDVPYKQALYTTVSQTLDRRPTASFDIVAVTPNKGTPAEVALKTNQTKRNAERVFRSLTEMGLPGDRVSLSATTSTAAQTSEVHIYIR
jgi:hypothetical protein